MAAQQQMTGDQQKLMDEVICAIKACLNSVKGEIPMETLHKDYRELEGKPIPYRELHHATLASFLQSVPEVIQLRNRGGQLFASLVRKAGAADHIGQMVDRQKTTKKQPKVRQRPARHPKRPSAWVPPSGARNASFTKKIEQSWQEPFKPYPGPNFGTSRHANTSLRQNYTQQRTNPSSANSSNPNPKPNDPNTKANNLPARQHNPRQGTKTPSPEPTASSPKPTNNAGKSGLFYNDGTWVIPRAVRNNQEKQFAPYFEVPPRFNNSVKGSEGKPGGKTYKQLLEEEVKKFSSNEEVVVFRTIPWGKKKQYWLSTVTILNRKVSSFPEEKEKPEDAEELVAKNALELLRQMNKPDLPVQNDMDISVPRVKELLAEQNSDILWWVHVRELYQNRYQEILPENWIKSVDQNKSGILLENPCQDRWTVRLAQQKNEIKAPRNTSVPNYLDQHLRAKPQPLRQPTAEASQVYDEFCQHIENERQQQLVQQQQPPRQQHQELHYQKKEFIERKPFVPKGKEVSSTEVMSALGNLHVGKAEGSLQEPSQIPPLELPNSNYWDIYVTYIQDFNNIKFRLIGDQYSNSYDDLVTDMELYYMEEKNLSPVSETIVGKVYAASYDESWFRVQILSVNGDQVTVLFIDHGDEEQLSISLIHNLHKNFCNLPAQNVSCALAGLEYGGKDQSALNLLQTLALGQTLVGQVVSRQDSISLILFNTATEEDININEKVSQQLDLNFVEPTLPQVGGVAEVYVMHVTSSGDIYVQIETETFKLLENLLEMARSRTEEMLGEDVKIDPTRLYLAQFSEDGQWYRAAPRSSVDPDGKVLMWFVDFGNSDRVPSASLRPLEGVNERLTKIPHQALLCRLHNVPSAGLEWTERACHRLMELLPEDSPLLLKVQAVKSNGPPLVELFKRLQPQNELVSINATLSIDNSLFRNDGDSNNNSVNKEVVLSPSRTRSRRSSTNSQTSSSSGLNSGPSSMNSYYESTPTSPRPGALIPMEVPRVGEYFDVYVTYAASPSNFAVQSWKMTKKLSALMSKMHVYYNNANNLQTLDELQAGGFYAVKHSDDSWYRAQVSMHQGDIVSGLFVDYGDCFIVTRDSVQPLPTAFHALPYQAIKAKLSGISAANLDWTPEDCCRFQELVEYREFVSIVANIESANDSDGYIISLRLINTSDPKLDVYIDQILVDEGRAVRQHVQ
ncbi:tudor domain-containing protein 7B-like isoform X1 [Penaeus chinensis]|uniref:tudor domain-containing protein 7B-like isoform X1 n=1 Tax=Penaeus chinensis TaxID=139456 RepID=UPI001FB77FAB|nr:tudor domain-containing protein 7B-like isoform X1 [Penaeus chinensis]